MGAFEWLYSFINGSLRLTSIFNSCFPTCFLIQVIDRWQTCMILNEIPFLAKASCGVWHYLHDKINTFSRSEYIQHGPLGKCLSLISYMILTWYIRVDKQWRNRPLGVISNAADITDTGITEWTLPQFSPSAPLTYKYIAFQTNIEPLQIISPRTIVTKTCRKR